MSPRFDFPFPGDRFAAPPVHVTLVGTNDSVDYDFTRGPSANTAVECVTEGAGRLIVGGTEYRLGPGDAVILHAGVLTRICGDPGVRWRTTWCIVAGKAAASVLAMYGLDGVFHIPQSGQTRLFQRLLRAAERRAGSPGDVGNRLAALFYELAIGLSSIVNGRRQGVAPVAMRIKDYIDTHAEEPIRLADMARAAGRSAVQTSRIFKRQFGLSPYDYLLERRMDIARLLLTAREMPIHGIAYRLHFSDPYHFSKTFKKRVGVPPSVYRGQAS